MVPAVMADQLMADFDIGAAALGYFSSFYYLAAYQAVFIAVMGLSLLGTILVR